MKESKVHKRLEINILGSQKICSFNCVYCDLGPSTMTMNQIRREYVFPTLEEIMSDLQKQMQSMDKSEYDTINLGGRGEPLLHPQIAEIITSVVALRDQNAPYAKIELFCNGAHIGSRKIINALNKIDQRIIKLDAGNAETLKKINATLVRLTVDRLAQDIKKLTDCTLRSTFVQGIVSNTSPEHLEDWLEIVGMIQPKKLQIMTPTKAIFRKDIQAVDEDTLETIASRVRRRLPSVEISVLTR